MLINFINHFFCWNSSNLEPYVCQVLQNDKDYINSNGNSILRSEEINTKRLQTQEYLQGFTKQGTDLIDMQGYL